MDLIQYLIKKRIFGKNQEPKIKAQAKETGKTLEEVIIEEKILPEKKLFELKSDFLKIPLKKKAAEGLSPDFSVIPRESVEFYKMIPLKVDKKQGLLEVGMVFPENSQAREALKFLARQQKLAVKVFLIALSDFREYLSRYRTPEKEVERALKRLKEEPPGKGAKEGAREAEFERLVEEAPIVKMVSVILRQAVEGKASDIHIEPFPGNLRVRYRLDGILYHSLTLPLKIHSAVVARIKIMGGLKIDETRVPQDGRFSIIVDDRKVDFRVSTLPTTLGEKVVLRVLSPEEGMKSLRELGFRDRNFKVVEEATRKTAGVILATGPTGSGKTTTLYSLLGILNKEGVNIITLEDPVEYFIEGINQSQVKPEIGYTFARGLRQILRQDPDIIMVGEIRDEETASLAVHAGLTGHLVLSTLHTTNALGVIPRLVDMGVKPFLMPPTLSLSISQRLVRLLCPDCRKKVKLEGDKKKYILDKLKGLPPGSRPKTIKSKKTIYIYQAQGCKKCNFKGYSGRIGVFEVLKMTETLGDLIVKDPSEKELVKEARRQGMISMEEDGILKVLDGLTSLEEIMRVTEEL